MKYIYLLLLSIFGTSCNQLYQSKIFNNCRCETLSIENGVEIKDVFENYSFIAPDSAWVPYTHIDSSGASVTVGDSTKDGILVVSMLQLKKAIPWPSREEQLAEIEASFNVVEKGNLSIDESQGYWYFIKNEDGSHSLQATLGLEQEHTFFILSTAVVNPASTVKETLCKLEPILYSFKRFENSDDLALNYTRKTKYIQH